MANEPWILLMAGDSSTTDNTLNLSKYYRTAMLKHNPAHEAAEPRRRIRF